jgi:hypothetical protein
MAGAEQMQVSSKHYATKLSGRSHGQAAPISLAFIYALDATAPVEMKTSADSLNRVHKFRTCSMVRFRCPARNIETALSEPCNPSGKHGEIGKNQSLIAFR